MAQKQYEVFVEARKVKRFAVVASSQREAENKAIARARDAYFRPDDLRIKKAVQAVSVTI